MKARCIMPCGQCGNMLIIYEGDEICPTCKQISVLKFDTAVSVLSRLVELTTKIFDDELRKRERDTLLGNLSARRELFSREFFREHSILNTGRLVAFTLLIRRAVKFGNYRGKVPQESQDIELLVRAYEDVREFESMLLRVKANENAVLSLCKFNPQSFTLEEGRKTFKVVDTEKCRTLERMFARHNIFPAATAQQEFEKLKETGDQQSTKLKYELLIPQDFIKKHYEILTQIFVLFHRDRISVNPNCGPDFLTQLQGAGISAVDAAAGTIISNNELVNNDLGISVGESGKCCKVHDNKLKNNRFYGITFVDGEYTSSQDKISGGNVGVAAISFGVKTIATLVNDKIAGW